MIMLGIASAGALGLGYILWRARQPDRLVLPDYVAPVEIIEEITEIEQRAKEAIEAIEEISTDGTYMAELVRERMARRRGHNDQ